MIILITLFSSPTGELSFYHNYNYHLNFGKLPVFVPYRGTKFLSFTVTDKEAEVPRFSSPTGELSFYRAVLENADLEGAKFSSPTGELSFYQTLETL